MLRPVVIIGCGGAGQKAVRHARDSVARNLKQAGWDAGIPNAWQFLGVDIHTTQEDPSIPPLPNNDYVSILSNFNTYTGLNSAIEARFNPTVNPQAFAELQGWRPNPSAVRIPLKGFAGQHRAVGRTAGILALQESVQKRIEFAFSQCTAGGPELAEVSRHLQVDVPPGTPVPAPLTIIVGSMAGGTGAGIMLDVVDLVRRRDINVAFPVLVAFTPDIFGSIQTEAMTANAAAFMSEMMSAYWDDEATDSALFQSKVAVHMRGPHSIFLIGRKNIDGLDLLEPKNVYRAVGQTIGAITTSPATQLNFDHITACWSPQSASNPGGYGFRPAQLKGVASSFGSATLSIGRDRFRNYLKKLLHRSVIEHLAFGCESIGNAILGKAIKEMKPQEINTKLARHFFDQFLVESGLQESENRLVEILGNSFTSDATKTDSTVNIQDELKFWGSDLFHNLLKTVNNFVEKTGYLVVIEILHLCRESFRSREIAFKFQIESISNQYPHSQDHQLARERISLAFESIDAFLFEEFEATLAKSLGRIHEMAKTQDGVPAIIEGWPKNDGQVPTSFHPGPVEFFLEDYSIWPDFANHLLSESLGDDVGSIKDPVNETIRLLIRGGFYRDGKTEQTPPYIWSESQGSAPIWEPGQKVSITIADDFEAMTERIESWLMRPATELLSVLSEGLSAYLMPTHRKTGAAVLDHQQRLAKFCESLTEALKLSRPLIEVDNAMNVTVHPKPLSYTLSIQGFPFGHGHPARELTESVIQGFMNTTSNVDWAFSSVDTESVLIANFLEYPVHPSVVSSFTQPLKRSLAMYDSNFLQSSFWLWRRSHTLKKFIPLPESLRIAAIRGFAIARIFGTVTAEPQGQNKIATRNGVHSFPTNFLTETDRNNILPALLESMILSFADVPTKGKAAFDAYGALIDYGSGGGMASGFEITEETARIFATGDYGPVQILDHARASSFSTDPQGRVANAIKYLDANIARFDAIDALPVDPRSWRNHVGTVEPVDTLTRELIDDLRKAYVQVKEALIRFDQPTINMII